MQITGFGQPVAKASPGTTRPDPKTVYPTPAKIDNSPQESGGSSKKTKAQNIDYQNVNNDAELMRMIELKRQEEKEKKVEKPSKGKNGLAIA